LASVSALRLPGAVIEALLPSKNAAAKPRASTSEPAGPAGVHRDLPRDNSQTPARRDAFYEDCPFASDSLRGFGGE
jgi:hypothetical protein